MNPTFNERVIKSEIYHPDYNLDKKDNLDSIPEITAVFGIFAIIHETPIHCRYLSSTTNLRQSIRELYENPPNEGMKHFMQGPWIQMLCYEKFAVDSDLKEKEIAWTNEYKPNVNANGEYPEYNYEWIYDENGELKPEYANPPKARV